MIVKFFSCLSLANARDMHKDNFQLFLNSVPIVKFFSCLSLANARDMHKDNFQLFLNSVPIIYISCYVLFYLQQK